MNSITEKTVVNFWGKVDKEKSTTFYNGTRCWEWTARRNPKGYGQFSVGKKMEQAHRVSWVMANGNIPYKLQVLHHCDNPSCVNFQHLFVGTNKDNADDREMKGRGNHAKGDRHGTHTHPEKVARGENAGLAKLTWEQVRTIRRRYAWCGIGGDSSTTLAKKFGVHYSTILDIVRNKVWKE